MVVPVIKSNNYFSSKLLDVNIFVYVMTRTTIKKGKSLLG